MEESESERNALRLKIEMPSGQKKAVEMVHALFEKILKEGEVQLYSTSGLQRINEGSQVSYEMDYYIHPLPDGGDKLICLAQRLLRYSKEEVLLRRDMMPTLMASSPHFFTNNCIPAHVDIPVFSILFGNFISNGAMAVHWKVEFGSRSQGLQPDEIHAHFEYDRQKISIKFDKHGNDKDAGEWTIKWQLPAIRRIILDPLCGMTGKRRLHFELNCPAQIQKFKEKENERTERRWGDGYRFTELPRIDESDGFPSASAIADSNVICLEFGREGEGRGEMSAGLLYEILSRLRLRAGVPIEFASMDLINMIIGRIHPYLEDPNKYRCEAFKQRIVQVRKELGEDEDDEGDENREEFRLRYLIDALLSRGATVKDQLLVSHEVWDEFLKMAVYEFKQNEQLCLVALENLLNKVDEMKRKTSIIRLFTDEVLNRRRNWHLQDDMSKEGYQRVRKVVVTPTRLILIPPEMIMGNRVLRTKDPKETKIIRVQFRDDDASPMTTMKTSEHLINKKVGGALNNGIKVGGRHFMYLGQSNSQMRDHGAYFFHTGKVFPKKADDKNNPGWKEMKKAMQKKKILKIRKSFGKFDNLKSVPKFMARMGQCFTQSRASGVILEGVNREVAEDIIGGDDAGEPYTYSDGVGQISRVFASQIATDLQLGLGVPSVYQFRQRGCKGVVAVHPRIDELNSLWQRLDIKKELRTRFRPSQEKFKAPESPFEVVKFSAPTPVSLNKPFINILDQVAGMQSLKVHMRMCDRIEELLDMQLRRMANTLINEHACRNKLKELPRRYSIDTLSVQNGFNLTVEPFFRSQVKAAVRFMIQKQLNKQQVQIPHDLGRSMFGIVDETGLLQYGQVFVQYHERMIDKVPKPTAKKRIHTGTLLISKMPCIVSGDVRLFEAIDIPDLRHLVDVVVFPQHGPRPHPDEMAGSDLDGDEYSVIFDPLLFIDHNERAMIYPKSTLPPNKSLNIDPTSTSRLDEQMQEFYVQYLTSNTVGVISLAHLTNSDLYGIETEVCNQIAYKNAQALDFPKTGNPPEDLKKGWTKNKDGVDIPPEKPERRPDFMQKNTDPCYASPRLIGRIFREIQHVEEVLNLSEEKDEHSVLTLDEGIDCEGWEEMEESVRVDMNSYNNELRAIMENYGIQTEGELMSGYLSQIRNRISDRDGDDMSFFNTNQVIEQKISLIVRRYRERFFEEFGGFSVCTENAADKRIHDEENVFDRVAVYAEDRMKKKAVAAYRICYGDAKNQVLPPRLLSFAWIAFDVLALVKKDWMMEKAIFTGEDPIEKMVGHRLMSWVDEHKDEMENAAVKWQIMEGGKAVDTVKRFMDCNECLAELCFAVCGWAEQGSLLSSRFSSFHLVLLLIQFGLGHYAVDERLKKTFLTPPPPDASVPSPRPIITNPGLFFMEFLSFLSSRAFRRRKFVSFSEPSLGCRSFFTRGEWMNLHRGALKMYYELVFSLRLDLPSSDGTKMELLLRLREMPPFIVELPEDADDEDVGDRICRLTGAAEVRLRRQGKGHKTHVVVTALGHLSSHSRIRRLLIIEPPIRTAMNEREMSDKIPQLVYEKIMRSV